MAKETDGIEGETVTCELCGKAVDVDNIHMNVTPYVWDDEPAHAKCVIDRCSFICRDECGFMSDKDEDCQWCGRDMILMIDEKRKELLEKGI